MPESILVGFELQAVRRVSWAAVSQFEGFTTDNRPVYVRLRHGGLTVSVGSNGQTIGQAVATEPVFECDYGGRDEFHITWPEIERVTGLRCVGVVEDFTDK
jgi:hypothetical protein